MLVLVFVPLLLLTGTVIFLTAYWSTTYTNKLLINKVNTDLNVTRDVFQRIERDRQRSLAALSKSSLFLHHLKSDNTNSMQVLLQNQSIEADFDFINILSPDGNQRLEADGWHSWKLKPSPLSEKMFEATASTDSALQAKESTDRRPDAAAGIEIYTSEFWSLQSAELARKIVFPLIDTPFATPSTRTVEDRAMVIRVLQRVRDSNAETLAILEGGLLLNRNYDFVDHIRDLVYGPGSLAEGSRGTVTVFLDDVRITTNVPGNDQSRALGTRVSVEVREAVLDNGTPWIDRAFVVHDWYISAYEPIVDVNKDRVGMLYAGYLEAPYKSDLNKAIMLLSGVVIAGCLLALVTSTLGAKTIFKPVESIAQVVRATAAGKRMRIGQLGSNDEISELANQFDSMLDTLEQHSARIEADAHELEHKVEQRTLELRAKNARLEEAIEVLKKTKQQLAMAEKLAAVGQLTAGVAHEINNPTAVILGNMDILIDEIGDKRRDVKVEIDLIIEQVYRIRSITDRLLQYSRPSADSSSPELLTQASFIDSDIEFYDSQVYVEKEASSFCVNHLIEDCLILVQHELADKTISLNMELSEVPNVLFNEQELKQVVVNLVSNAIQAVKHGGCISIRTNVTNDNQVKLEIEDNGVGIEEANLQKVFDPFFTSGKEGGTGLGLSVSYGIVRRYGGAIEVESTLGEGALFRLLLPLASSEELLSA